MALRNDGKSSGGGAKLFGMAVIAKKSREESVSNGVFIGTI